MGGGAMGGGAMGGAMGGGAMGRGAGMAGGGGMPPLPPYPQQGMQGGQLPGMNSGGPQNNAMPPLPPSFDQSAQFNGHQGVGGGMTASMGGGMGASMGSGWDGSAGVGSGGSGPGGGVGGFGNENGSMSQLEMQMSGLSTTGASAAAPEQASAPPIDIASFLSAALPLLWQIESFKAQLMHISPAADSVVVGMQQVLGALTENRAALGPPAATRTALPILFGEMGRSKLTHATEGCEAFEGMLAMFTESSDQRFVACVERHCSMSIMEMCECSCDEMLEPLHYKQSAAYVSVPLLLNALPAEGGVLASQLASSIGPLCPTANCGNRMRILRYLMSPMPNLLTVGLAWDSTPAQPNAIHALLSSIELSFDLQHAFKSVPQPASASIRGVLCGAGATFQGFAHDAVTSTWHYHGDGISEVVGEQWDQVVSKCSLGRFRPVLLLYQIHSAQY